jgi:hypothetical protein
MKQVNLSDTKKCSNCNEYKLINDFYRTKSICKKCYSIKTKKYFYDHQDYYEKNKDKILKRNQEWRKNNPEKSRGCVHRWQRNNPEKLKEYIRKWQKNNRDKLNVYQRKYQQNNPEKIKEYTNKYLLKHPKPKKIRKKIYSTPEERKKIRNARNDARKRKKGFYPLIQNIFPKDIPVDYHHIYNGLPFVIPVPKTIHQKYMNGNLSFHQSNVNKWIEEVNILNISKFLD